MRDITTLKRDLAFLREQEQSTSSPLIYETTGGVSEALLQERFSELERRLSTQMAALETGTTIVQGDGNTGALELQIDSLQRQINRATYIFNRQDENAREDIHKSVSTSISTKHGTFSEYVTISEDLTVGTNTLYVDAGSGRVGINTVTPAYALDISGSLRASTIDATTGSFTGDLTVLGDLTIQGAQTLSGAISVPYINATSTTATSTFAGGLNVGNNTLIYDHTTGNVGIATSSPFKQFSVVGDAYIKGGLTINGNASITEGGALTVGDKVIAEGEIGVGTTTPAGKLSIQNTLTSQKALLLYGAVGQTADLLSIYDNPTSNANLLTLTADGKVGIRTTDPLVPLHVRVPGGVNISSVNANTRAMIEYGGGISRLAIVSNSSSSAELTLGDTDSELQGRLSYNNTNNSLGLHTLNTERVRIDSSGNVGIGTADPTSKLEIYHNGIYNGASENLRLLGTGTKYLKLGYDSTSNFAFLQSIESGVSFRDLVLNAQGGNVGIGTTSPAEKLHIYNGNVEITKSTNPQIIFSPTSGADYGYIGANGYQLSFGVTGSERATLSSNSLFTLPTIGAGVTLYSATDSTGLDLAVRKTVRPNSSYTYTTQNGGSYPFDNWGNLI